MTSIDIIKLREKIRYCLDHDNPEGTTLVSWMADEIAAAFQAASTPAGRQADGPEYVTCPVCSYWGMFRNRNAPTTCPNGCGPLTDCSAQSTLPVDVDALVEGLILDAMSVLHHDGGEDGETPEDTYHYAMLRKKFGARLTITGASNGR